MKAYYDDIYICQNKASSCSTGWPPRLPRRRTQQLQPCRHSSAPPLDFSSATVVDRALWEWRKKMDRSIIRTIPDDYHVSRTFNNIFSVHKTIPAVYGAPIQSCDIVINTANVTSVSFDWWKYTMCISSKNTDLTRSFLSDPSPIIGITS